MKKNRMKYLIATFFILFIIPSLVRASTPYPVIIHYTGDIVVQPCSISTDSISIDFGDIDISKLATINSASHTVNVALNFNDCDIDTIVLLNFNGMDNFVSGRKTAYSNCGSFIAEGMNDNGIYFPTYVIAATTNYNGADIDLACYSQGKVPLSIYPIQRKQGSPSFSLPLSFRLVRYSSAAAIPLKVSGGKLMDINITYK